jgi:hypothetical protein
MLRPFHAQRNARYESALYHSCPLPWSRVRYRRSSGMSNWCCRRRRCRARCWPPCCYRCRGWLCGRSSPHGRAQAHRPNKSDEMNLSVLEGSKANLCPLPCDGNANDYDPNRGVRLWCCSLRAQRGAVPVRRVSLHFVPEGERERLCVICPTAHRRFRSHRDVQHVQRPQFLPDLRLAAV